MISIVIPVYNSSKYLGRCLNTVLNQDYPNIEVVLVDDGSTDGCAHLCDEYAEKDIRIRVIHQQNQGASIARQNGLRNAKGEYVTFIDSDDWVANDYVSKLYNFIVEHHITVSACGVQRVKENENINFHRTEHQSFLLSFEELMPRFFKYEFWGFPGKLYKKSVLSQITFPKATLSEDYLVMTQLFLKERQMAYTEAPLYFYEYHPNSLSHQRLSKRAFEEFENVKAVYELIKEQEPQFEEMVFANVVETCIKLNLMILHGKSTDFQQEYIIIRNFLKSHYNSIINCKYMTWKTKTVAIGLILFPNLTANLKK